MTSLRITFRRRPVAELDGELKLHARIWDVYEKLWRWEWRYDRIPLRVRASLLNSEREQLRRLLVWADEESV